MSASNDNWNLTPEDWLPDVRDGLSRVERVILWCLGELQRTRPRGWVASAQLYGRVVEYINITPEDMQEVLRRLGADRDVR